MARQVDGWRANAWPLFGLATLTLVVYLRSLSGGFLWDDEILTTKNPLFFDPNPWYRIWCTTDATDYYPLTWSLFLVEWRLFGDHPHAYHAVNLLLHIVGVILVWRILEQLRVRGAWLAALVFSVHPVNVATVAWISQGKSTLALVFYACSVLCYLEYDEKCECTQVGEGDKARRWLALSFALFLAGLLSKASGLLLPVAFLAFTWWLRGKVDRRRVLAMVPFLALAVGMAFCTTWFQHYRAMEGDAGLQMGLVARLALAGWTFGFYLLHFLLPFPLMMVYPLEIVPDAADVLSVPPLGRMALSTPVAFLPDVLLVACIAAVCLARRAWKRPVVAGLAYILATLLPVMGLVEMSYMKFSVVSDHLFYMASIGFAALLVGGVAGLVVQPGRLRALGAGLIVVLAVVNLHYQAAYLSSESLWRENLARNPNCWVAHFNLGSILEDQKRYPDAVSEYQQALRLSRPDRGIWYNLGHAWYSMGRNAQAIECYRQALKVDDSYADAHNNLGTVLELTGAADEALWHYQKALACRPDFPEAHYNLGTLLAVRGQDDQAVVHLRAALTLRPEANPQACGSLARVLMRRGDLQQARVLAIRAIQSDPAYVEAYRVLGVVLFEQKQDAEAAVVLEKARKLEPRNAEVLGHLGLLAARQGRPREALAWHRAAVEVDPGNPEHLNEVAWLQATSLDPGVRNGQGALRLARHVCEMTEYHNASFVDTLAAAQAEVGDFGGAVESARKALELARQAGDASLARGVAARLDLYGKAMPARE